MKSVMKKKVVILGAGKLGALLYDCLVGDERWVCNGFHDDAKAGQTLYGLPVLGTGPDELTAGQVVIMAIGDPSVRRTVVARLESRGLDWQTFIDRRSVVGPNARIGQGALILCFSMLSSNATIGSFTYCSAYSHIGSGSIVGSFTTVLAAASVGGSIVGEECILGIKSICIDGAKLGNRVTVAPASFVHRDVPDNAFVMGNPARIFKQGAPGFATQGMRRLSENLVL
jgi:sugar O-acyltransferase (sialic acid O-acetyltransferase NeuD family)